MTEPLPAESGRAACTAAAAAAATDADAAARAARDEALVLDGQRRALLEYEAAVQSAETAALTAIGDTFTAAGAVVTAQNAAAEQNGAGNTAQERELLTTQAVPATQQYRAAVEAVVPTLPPLRTAVADLATALP